MKDFKDYMAKGTTGYGPDVPDWYDPEDEGSCIAATYHSVFSEVNDLNNESNCETKFKAIERYSFGVKK
jgi:hypothetical protein